MKVLNLRCAHDHRFEGWFASHDEYERQAESGAVACPLCGDAEISRLPSAPRLNVSKQREQPVAPPDTQVPDVAMTQSRVMRAMRHMLDNTEDVGARFPEEARRIHYGEAAERNIRGRATHREAQALAEEGIDVVAMKLPPSMEGPLQ